jgi:hypothetical protein
LEVDKTVTPVPERFPGALGAAFKGPIMIAGDYDFPPMRQCTNPLAEGRDFPEASS